jgi:hypothetical protein
MVRRISTLAALLAIAIGLFASTAAASRRPTRGETQEIRAGALLSLQGSGWRVSGIRVSSVSSHYAKAAVQQGRGGPVGEMILRLRHGIWHQSFLGTNDFCSAPVPKRVLDDLGFRC